MYEVKCLDDIKQLANGFRVPNQMIALLMQDLSTIKEWEDQDHEYTLENFNTDYTNNGYIAILEGNETPLEIEQLGLTGGLDHVIPEDATIYYMEDDKWVRSIIIYNDSFSMIVYVKNYDGFDSYAV